MSGMPGMTLTTYQMLMALEEMPPHTLYRGVVFSRSPIAVYRCDCVPGGAYVMACDPLTRGYGVSGLRTERDDFLLDLGYRGVSGETQWARAEVAACDCDRSVSMPVAGERTGRG